MYFEGYVFYISFVGMVILLLYKVRAVRAYDRANKNYIHFDPFPKTRLYILEGVQVFANSLYIHVWKPLRGWIVRKIIYILQSILSLTANLQYGRKKLGKMIEKRYSASRYVQKVVEQKKKIRHRIKK